MKTSADGAWYFSRDGQQSGPLSYADLKEKADEGVLRPRTDLVWKEGMPDWVPIGEIEGLFERREVAPPPPAAEQAAIDAALIGEEPQVQLGQFGGSRRRAYFFVLFILPALMLFLLEVAKGQFPSVVTPQIAGRIEKYGPVALMVMALYTTIQRFANLGMSRWWIFGNLVPLLNLWTGYRCFACPEGYAVHKQMDGIGILLAILYWLFLLAVVAVITAAIAILAGAAGNPEIQQQIKEALANFQTQLQSHAPAK